MDLVLVMNPTAGRGKGRRTAAAIAEALRDDGHDVAEFIAGPGRHEEGVGRALSTADAAIVVGGDGTLHHMADLLIATETPVYHVPLGTENLFAREFAMNAKIETLREALRKGEVQKVDVARCAGRAFILMCSLGFDAAVVARLARIRGASISHLSYVKPILAEAIAFKPPRFIIEADGERLVDDRRGLLIVANCRQYGARLDPAAEACMTDAMLDMVFLPFTSRLGLIRMALAARTRRLRQNPRVIARRARRVTVETPEGPTPIQMDGEAVLFRSGEAPSLPSRLEITIEPAALRVLAPGGAITPPSATTAAIRKAS
ncbi:MAG: diacylglycerol kinase family protein [Planctomycetota bacterium]|nr:diacylglycerol kinase family protein [Planctomycetota bacterium]